MASHRTRIPVRSVIGLLEPERLAPSTHEVDADADLEAEFAQLSTQRAEGRMVSA